MLVLEPKAAKRHSLVKRRRFTLIQVGWTVFGLGVIWDLVYHGLLFVYGLALPAALDLIGGLGHGVTFAGSVVIIYALLRRRRN
jgi:hypothetical protein